VRRVVPTLTLDRLAFGGDAVGRIDGKAVFVPFGAPGDVVEVEVDVDRERWSRARLVRIAAPGPDRTPPPCPHFERCGGCQWQHLASSAQRDAKRAIVAEHLARIAGLGDVEVAPIETGPEWGYRDRVTLACRPDVIGLRALRSHEVVPVAGCPIASDPIREHLADATMLVRALDPDVRTATIVAGDGGVVLVATGGRPSLARARAARAAAAPAIRGVVWRGAGRRVAVGEVAVRRTLEPGLELLVPADVFSQVGAWAHRALVARVVALAGSVAGRTVLDVYCGAGTLGIPLARRGARVHGIERERAAVAAAAANASRLGLVDFDVAAGDARATIGTAPAADLVVLDPPRRGAADLVGPLLARRPAQIVYVSCDPATFARDAGRLVRGGYRLGPVHPLDVFPQTYHVELAASLRLT
jgi:23S rRNA (uracil1939-C5)-methyltransferase